jgi:hypothetical protein
LYLINNFILSWGFLIKVICENEQYPQKRSQYIHPLNVFVLINFGVLDLIDNYRDERKFNEKEC